MFKFQASNCCTDTKHFELMREASGFFAASKKIRMMVLFIAWRTRTPSPPCQPRQRCAHATCKVFQRKKFAHFFPFAVARVPSKNSTRASAGALRSQPVRFLPLCCLAPMLGLSKTAAKLSAGTKHFKPVVGLEHLEAVLLSKAPS